MSPVSAFDFSLLVRLMMAARDLALSRFAWAFDGAGANGFACAECSRLQALHDCNHHAPACKVGAVLAALAQLEPHGPAIREGAVDSMNVEGRPRTSPEQTGAGQDPDSLAGLAAGGVIGPGTATLHGARFADLSVAAAAAWRQVNDHVAAAVGDAATAGDAPAGGDAATAGDAPAGGDRGQVVVGQVIDWPGAPGHAADRNYALGYPPGDYGEPWRVDTGDPAAVAARDGREVFHAGTTELHEQDEQRFARRLAACVNLCANAPTEVLEHAFTTMAAQYPRWILIAVSAEHLTPAKLAELSQHIDAATATGGRR